MIRLGVIILMFAAAAAFGYLGEVVGSFAAPGFNAAALGMSATTLYVTAGLLPSYEYFLNPTTGSVLGSWPITGLTVNCGMDYGNGYLWMADWSQCYVRQRDPAAGSTYASWPVNSRRDGVAPRCTGDGGVGTTSLFTGDASTCYENNLTTGSVISSFAWPAMVAGRDLAFDWRNGWIWKPDWARVIAAYKPDGTRVWSFDGPSQTNLGMAYAAQYLWVAVGEGIIYRIHCPGNMAVEPASFGKVRATFR
jgi:hypothetical protein